MVSNGARLYENHNETVGRMKSLWQLYAFFLALACAPCFGAHIVVVGRGTQNTYTVSVDLVWDGISQLKVTSASLSPNDGPYMRYFIGFYKGGDFYWSRGDQGPVIAIGGASSYDGIAFIPWVGPWWVNSDSTYVGNWFSSSGTAYTSSWLPDPIKASLSFGDPVYRVIRIPFSQANKDITDYQIISGNGSSVNAGWNVNPEFAEGFTKDPVDTGTGAHVITRTLLKIHGPQEFEFRINYSSLCSSSGVLGPGWSHNFETHLIALTNSTVKLCWSPNKCDIFTPLETDQNSFTCSDLPVVHDSLTRSSDGSYSLKEPSQLRYVFDRLGRLQQILNAHSQAFALTYESTNTLPVFIQEMVSGKLLCLSYDTNRRVLT